MRLLIFFLRRFVVRDFYIYGLLFSLPMCLLGHDRLESIPVSQHSPDFSKNGGIDQSVLDTLPFVDGKDEDSALYAAPYLPNNPVILEAGTCGGEDTCNFKRIWESAVIYGFEPMPYSYKRTLENTNSLRDVTIFPYALSNAVGEAVFFVSQVNAGCSSLLPDNFSSVVWPFERDPSGEDFSNNHYKDVPISVSTTTINTWGKENRISHIDYIWLDTEGAELQILSSATDFLHNVRVISTEVNFQEFRSGMTQFSDLYVFLTKHNFSLKYIYANPKWQGVAMFINNKFLDAPLNFSNPYLIPSPIKR